MEVVIPPDYQPGQQLPVEIPGFGRAMLAVPGESKAGDLLKFDVPDAEEIHRSRATTLLRPQNNRIAVTTPMYSVNIPKNSPPKIMADVSGVGQVAFCVPSIAALMDAVALKSDLY